MAISTKSVAAVAHLTNISSRLNNLYPFCSATLERSGRILWKGSCQPGTFRLGVVEAVIAASVARGLERGHGCYGLDGLYNGGHG